MAANTAAGYETATGAGGKFRKKPFRRSQTTPYDRPITALRPTQVEAQKNGWISKLIEPASKLITSSAHKLFASVFRKRLLPPPNPSTNSPDENLEIVNVQPPATVVATPAATQETVIGGVDIPSRNSDGDGIAELEDILKQKTFTRSEIDQLTALLLSRTADNSAVAEKSSEPKNSDQQASDYRYEDGTNVPTQENMEKHVVFGAISTPAMKSEVLKEDVASPAELAKAYMGSRPRQVSPSMLGLNNQMYRDCVPTANNPPFKARSPVTSLLQKPFSDVGTSENGFATPRYRGKSAIYCMARTPYSRIHPATTLKDPDSTMGGHSGLFLSRKAVGNDQLNGSKKQVMKRRSSVLENDIGSVGPIRRIRQKPNLLHPKVLTLASSDATRSTLVYGASPDATEIPSSNWNSHTHSFSKSIADNSMPGTSSAFVPSQSIETAQKIFKQLDKFSPKGKSPGLKIDIEGGTPPGKMTSTVLGSPVHRSMETEDALKVSPISGDGRKENAPRNNVAGYDPPSKKSLMVEEASLKKAEVPSNDRSPEIGVEVRMPDSNTSHDMKVADESLVQPPKKRAFQMSAHEDYLEPDDDVQLNGHASTQLSEGEANTGSAKKSAAIHDIPSQNEKPAVKDQELVSNGPVTASNATASFTFPAVAPSSPATSTGVPGTASARPSASLSDDVIPKKELKLTAPDFSAKSDKFPSAVESAVQKDTKLKLPNSSTDVVPNANGSAEKDTKNTQGSSGEVKKSGDDSAPGASTTKGPFSFGLHVSKQSLDNGLPSTIPATSTSSPNLFSGSCGKQSPPITSSVPSFLSGSISFSNGFVSSASTTSIAAPSGSTTNSIANLSPSSSSLPSLVTISSVSSAPIFQFGTSTASLTSAASASGSAVVSADNSGAKSSEMAFDNTTSSSLFSPVTSIGGSGIFGFNASTIKPASSEGQTAAPVASSGFVFGFQASSSTAPATTSTPSFPTQSSSSTSTTSVFGFSAATTPSSGLFTSGSASVASPAAVSSSSVSSSSGTTSNTIFSTNWQPSKPSFPTFSTSSSTGFSFGASASGTSTEANKTAVAFGSTNSSSSPAGNSSPFVFGGLTNASTSPVFSFGGNTISSTPISTPAAPSQPAFGNNFSTPTFGFGSTPPGNGDQMSLEDSMAEDSMQPSTPTPVFGQPPIPAPASGSFVFGQTPSTGFGGAAAPPSTGNPFSFGSQPNQMASPSPSPFQPSGSVEFNAGGAGSFSLGASGDKGGRKYIKPRRLPKRK